MLYQVVIKIFGIFHKNPFLTPNCALGLKNTSDVVKQNTLGIHENRTNKTSTSKDG